MTINRSNHVITRKGSTMTLVKIDLNQTTLNDVGAMEERDIEPKTVAMNKKKDKINMLEIEEEFICKLYSILQDNRNNSSSDENLSD